MVVSGSESPHLAYRLERGNSNSGESGVAFWLHPYEPMLKLIGSYALAKLLGFGILGAIVIYLILSLLT
jgi:hypothetical protein